MAFSSNDAILANSFSERINRQLITTRSRLDIGTLADPAFVDAFVKADELQGLSIVGHAVDLAISLLEVWAKLRLLRAFSKTGQISASARVVNYAILSAFLLRLGWFLHPSSREVAIATLPALRRLRDLWSLSARSDDPEYSADMKMMGLGPYLTHNYDVACIHRDSHNPKRITPETHLQQAMEVAKDTWPTLLRCWYALSFLRLPGGLHTLGQLRLTVMCARKLAAALNSALSAVDDIRLECTKIRAFFRIIDTKSRIEDPVTPIPYKQAMSANGNGMDIQATNVSFAYNQQDDRKAAAESELPHTRRQFGLRCWRQWGWKGKFAYTNLSPQAELYL